MGRPVHVEPTGMDLGMCPSERARTRLLIRRKKKKGNRSCAFIQQLLMSSKELPDRAVHRIYSISVMAVVRCFGASQFGDRGFVALGSSLKELVHFHNYLQLIQPAINLWQRSETKTLEIGDRKFLVG
ncbi:hypothetical protein QOT17_013036 [Balamuthia mandrillaris]